MKNNSSQNLRQIVRRIIIESQSLDDQILARSDFMRGLMVFIENNPGTTTDEMFDSPVANAIIPIGIRERAILVWVKKLIKDGFITSKRYRLYSTGKAQYVNHNVVVENVIMESAKFSSYDAFTREENLDLRMMEHDKGHINLEKNSAITKAFQVYSETTTVSLFRGIYNTETKMFSNMQPGDTFRFGRVTSLSENFEIAKKFGYGKMVELVPGTEGCFSFVDFLVDYYDGWKRKDPMDYEMQDGDWRKGSAEREAEWFVSGDTQFQLLDVAERDGKIVYKIKTL